MSPSRQHRRRIPALAATGLTASLALVGAASGASAAPAAALNPGDPPGSFSEQNLGADRTSANFFYRIPALAYLGNDVVIASWDGRPGGAGDAPNPNSIVQRRSTDGGKTWGPVQVIAAGHVGDASGPKYGYSDPSYVVDHEAGKVFAFFVYSKDVGFAASQYGNDDADRNVISAAVIESADAGQSWSTPRLITDVAKPGASKTNPQPGDVKSMFASSGEGIQLRYGAHKGRLIQQFAGRVKQADGSEAIQAYSVYSDDHGATWHKGESSGTAMDENKTVELSDGRVMLNSRDNAGSGFRKVLISNDGGQTYGPVTLDKQLIDPTNNGSITRLFPNAAQGSAEAKKLLFTNSASQTSRSNVSARVSCDDGKTWPGLRSIRPGFSAYSTATRLGGNKIGVFYEADYTANMVFGVFDDAWLNYVCAPLATPDLRMDHGTTSQVPVTITNQEQVTLSGGTTTIAAPSGWAAETVAVPDIAPGASVTVEVPLTAPTGSNGTSRLDATFTAADGRTSHYGVVVTVKGVAEVGLTITGSAASRDVVANPYAVGEKLAYTFTVKSTGTVAADAVPLSGSFDEGFLPPNAPNCRYRNLAAGASYTCTSARHVVTADDVSKGWLTPSAEFSVTSTTDPALTKTVTFSGAPVLLRDPATVPLGASITGVRTDDGRDLATSPYVSGEQVPYRFDVTNTSPFGMAVVPMSGAFVPFVPAGPGNCRYLSLAAGASYTCATPRHLVTQSEADAGFFDASTEWELAAGGKTPVTIQVPASEVDLKVRQPDLDATTTPVWIDVDGDRYASAGDRIEITRTLGNSGNVTLTDVRAQGVELQRDALPLGASVSETSVRTLSTADVSAGTVSIPGWSATARNGAKDAAVTVAGTSFVLDVKPAKPVSNPTTVRKDYGGRTSPIDLGLDSKYRAGQKLTADGLPYGQWYFVYVNGTQLPLGWHFPTINDRIELILPASIKNGADTLVVLDAAGQEVAFDRLHITPKGR